MSELQFCVEKEYFNDYIFLHLPKKLSDISQWGIIDILFIILLIRDHSSEIFHNFAKLLEK